MVPPAGVGVTLDVCFTVDVECDCPPFLSSYRGIQSGMPALLDLLDALAVPATFFSTGDVARRFPRTIEDVVRRGHELGSHGMTHRRFSSMTPAEATVEIEQSAEVLRGFAPVISFRAPNLDFPARFLPLLPPAGFRLDSSQARYKWARQAGGTAAGLARIPVSVTSSVLRLPTPLRDPWLRRLRSPVVLFVHPWEFVDLSAERLRYDCRFRTGATALACVQSVLEGFTVRGARFHRMSDLPSGGLTTSFRTPAAAEPHPAA